MVFYDQDLAGPDAVYIGKEQDIRVTVYTDEDRTTRKSINGATATYVISTRPGSASEVSKTVGSGIVLSDPTNGVLTITLDTSDTSGLDDGFYHHDLTITDTDGNDSVVFEGIVELRRASS